MALPDQFDLFRLDASGDLKPLTDDRLSFEPAISPDGTWIAFTRARAGTYSDAGGYTRTSLRTMGIDGDGIASIPARPGWDDSSAAVSPDGSRIAFLRSKIHGNATMLMLADPDGSDQTSLATLDPWGGGRPAWSPDGATIALNATDGKTRSLLLIGAASGTIEEQSIQPEGDPAWSADGNQLLLSSRRYESPSAVHEVAVATARTVEISDPPSATWTNASYADKEGKRLLVLRFEQTVELLPQRLELIDRSGHVLTSTAIESLPMIDGTGRTLLGGLSHSRCFLGGT